MSSGRARNEGGILANAFATSKSAGDHAQRAEAWFRQLEDRRRRAVDVSIDQAHLGADVTSCMPRELRDSARAIVPAQAGQPNAAWVSSHDERSVGGSGHGRESRCHSGERPFLAQTSERGELASSDGAREHIRSHTIGDEDHDLRTITWRASCRSAQL